MAETGKVGKQGLVVVPAALRERCGIGAGSLVAANAARGGLILPPPAYLLGSSGSGGC